MKDQDDACTNPEEVTIKIPIELRETWFQDERGILNGITIWSDYRNKEPVGILSGFSKEDTNRVLLLPRLIATLVAIRIAVREDLSSGTLSTCAQLLPELEELIKQLGVPLPDANDT